MCLYPKSDNESSDPMDDDMIEMIFACLGHYHEYTTTGAVGEGIDVSEADGVLSFRKPSSFTGE